MAEHDVDVLVVGSGCAGSLLAWGLALAGRSVALVERHRHPRVVLGESTTPLANLALERLAVRFGSEPLYDLANWGRSQRRHAGLLRGLKRGFSFHLGSTPDVGDRGCADSDRLLVAASPSDDLADQQWYRAQVDRWLVERAIRAGARLWDRTVLEAPERAEGGGWRIRGVRLGAQGGASSKEPVSWRAGFLVDASGAGAYLSGALDLADGPRVEPGFEAHLLGGHFTGVEQLPASRHDVYPVSWGAVHQLVETGWMYQLRFDDGLVSAGFVHRASPAPDCAVDCAAETPWQQFERLLADDSRLARQFAGARPVRDLWRGGLVYRRRRAVGRDWALLPQSFAFFGPLYSTGLAWSFLGVERLLDLLEVDGDEREALLERYGYLLACESDHVERLIACTDDAFAEASYAGSLDPVARISRLYFVAASHQETTQRLFDAGERAGMAGRDWCWSGFLGADDQVLVDAVHSARRRQLEGDPVDGMELWRLLAARDVGRFTADPLARQVTADLETVVDAAGILGLSAREVRRRLPRLIGLPWPERIAER